MILALLGWSHAEVGPKSSPFADSFKVLGARIDFSRMNTHHQLVMSNTEERMAEIARVVLEFLKVGHISPGEARTLAGRLGFIRTYVSGRLLNVPLRILFDRAGSKSLRSTLDPDLRDALVIIRAVALRPSPAVVTMDEPTRPYVLYSDGAVEGGRMTYGAILFWPCGARSEFIMGEVPAIAAAAWARLGLKPAVAQTELYPVLLSKVVWHSPLRGQRLICFTDNEVVREALISGVTRHLATRGLLTALAAVDSAIASSTWIARVPSQSNPADAPSRGVVDIWSKPKLIASPLLPFDKEGGLSLQSLAAMVEVSGENASASPG